MGTLQNSQHRTGLFNSQVPQWRALIPKGSVQENMVQTKTESAQTTQLQFVHTMEPV